MAEVNSQGGDRLLSAARSKEPSISHVPVHGGHNVSRAPHGQVMHRTLCELSACSELLFSEKKGFRVCRVLNAVFFIIFYCFSSALERKV